MSRSQEFAQAVTSHVSVPFLSQGRASWVADKRLGAATRDFSQVVATPEATARVARAYGQLPEYDKSAEPHFKAMAEETMHQFEYLTKDLGVNVEVTKEDPYPSAGDMFKDITENRRIKVLSTASTGGHPFFTNDQNDAFRAVHDAFGHIGTGRGTDRHGEEAAYQAHRQMFTPMARPALTTETRGQNAAMIVSGEFQPQKVATLPASLQQASLSGSRSGMRRAIMQSRQFHEQQFGG